MKNEFYYQSYDGRSKIHTIEWIPQNEVLAVLQISHGMKEYIDRYDDFARYLNQFGIYVVGQDHLGHGASVSHNNYGFFHESRGNECLINDIRTLHLKTEEKYPNLPYFLLGHSMGSFLVRQYIGYYGRYLDGAIIMGTGQQPIQLVRLAKKILALGIKIKGPYYANHHLDLALSKQFNKKFEPVNTIGDWISKNESEVEKYVTHPWCTFDFTLSAYYDLCKSLERMSDPKTLKGIPKTLPIFIVSGQDDPVGDFGKGVQSVYELYKKQEIRDISIKLYPTDRHEILNENDRLTIYQDLYHWIIKKMNAKEKKE